MAAGVLESHIGCPIYLFKLMTNMKEFDKDDSDSVTKCGKQKHENFLAYVYLENADQSKYGSILSGLATQNSLRNEQYPKTHIEANNVLSNHEFDTKSVEVTREMKRRLERTMVKMKSWNYPLHNWKENVTVVASQGTDQTPVGIETNLNQNGL